MVYYRNKLTSHTIQMGFACPLDSKGISVKKTFNALRHDLAAMWMKPSAILITRLKLIIIKPCLKLVTLGLFFNPFRHFIRMYKKTFSPWKHRILILILPVILLFRILIGSVFSLIPTLYIMVSNGYISLYFH